MNTKLISGVSTEVENWFKLHATDPVFVLEANRFETMCLWKEYRDVWSDSSGGGYLLNVGELDGRPIVISVSTFKVHGQIVFAYEATSQLVDHAVIEQWLAYRFPALFPVNDYHYKTDAGNFHNVVLRALAKSTQ